MSTSTTLGVKKDTPRKREIWVDDVKVIACILVVLGHFFQSMTKASILPASDLYEWFIKTIYYFHVPLFFICSGYLYQRYSRVDGVESWGKNVVKKALTLGIPYFTFSFATWVLKTIFSSNVNNQIGGLFETLFLQPTSPYWYLYTLFFIFLITPTFRNRKSAIIRLTVAFIMKAVAIIGGGTQVYAVSSVLTNEIWFIGGMCLVEKIWKPLKAQVSAVIGVIFVILSILMVDIDSKWLSFELGILACVSIISAVRKLNGKLSKAFPFLSKYTMPIFVMHTLFAAPLRSVLLKIGINSAMIHVVLGIAVSFIGPIIAAEIMKKTKMLEFFLYPGKFIKVK